MNTQQICYKNVVLYDFRTPEIIDTIIKCKNNGMGANEIAKKIGIESHHPLSGIFRVLRDGGYIDAKVPKETKLKKESKPKKEIKKPKEAKEVFTNYCGTKKQKARNLIAEAIMQTKRQKSNILTLPADEWLMEKNILEKKNGYKFTAVERDKEMYKEMVKNSTDNEQISNSIIGMVNKTIGEVVVNDRENTYSSAILDYCGFIDSFFDEINDIMKRNLVKKDGFIAITLAENNRTLNNPLHSSKYTNKLINDCYENEEVNGEKVTNDLIKILVFNNAGYKIVKKYPYKDKTARMQLFIIKRID